MTGADLHLLAGAHALGAPGEDEWKLPAAPRAELGHPEPLVALDAALARFRSRRDLG